MVFYLEAGDELVLSGFQQQPAGDQGRGGWRERDCQRSQVNFISNICCQALDRKISRMNDSGNIKCVATNVLGQATTAGPCGILGILGLDSNPGIFFGIWYCTQDNVLKYFFIYFRHLSSLFETPQPFKVL